MRNDYFCCSGRVFVLPGPSGARAPEPCQMEAAWHSPLELHLGHQCPGCVSNLNNNPSICAHPQKRRTCRTYIRTFFQKKKCGLCETVSIPVRQLHSYGHHEPFLCDSYTLLPRLSLLLLLSSIWQGSGDLAPEGPGRTKNGPISKSSRFAWEVLEISLNVQ